MLDTLTSGKLIKQPELKFSKNGSQYCQFLLGVHVGDPDNVIVSCCAFGSAAERVAQMGKGDSLSVTGALKPTRWVDNTGAEKHGLSVTVSGVLSVHDIKKRRPKTEESQGKASDQYEGRPFDDSVTF